MGRVSRKTALLSSIASGLVLVTSGVYWWYTSGSCGSKDETSHEDQEIVSFVHEVQRQRNSFTQFLNPISKNKPIMTLSLKNIIVWNPLPDPKIPNYAFLEGTVPMIRSLARVYDLYLLMQVSSPEERRQIIHLFISAGLFRSSSPEKVDAIDQSRLVFCQSLEGKEYIARNLNSFIHIDTDVTTIRNLTPFVKRFVWVRRSSQDRQYYLNTKLQSTIQEKNESTNPMPTWYTRTKTGPVFGQVTPKSVWSEVLASNPDHLEICDDLVKSSLNLNRTYHL